MKSSVSKPQLVIFNHVVINGGIPSEIPNFEYFTVKNVRLRMSRARKKDNSYGKIKILL